MRHRGGDVLDLGVVVGGAFVDGADAVCSRRRGAPVPRERGEGRHGGLVRVDRQHAGCGRAAAVAAPAGEGVGRIVPARREPRFGRLSVRGRARGINAAAGTGRDGQGVGPQRRERRRRPTGGRVLRSLPRCGGGQGADGRGQEDRAARAASSSERGGEGCVARSHQGLLSAVGSTLWRDARWRRLFRLRVRPRRLGAWHGECRQRRNQHDSR